MSKRKINSEIRGATCEEMELDNRPHKPRVKRVRFGILGPEEIERMSTVSVTQSAILDKNIPKQFGVNDLRMGTVDRRFKCSTCGKGMMNCVGHPGHIELAFPLYHIGFLQSIVKILGCVCYFCSTCTICPTAQDGSAQDGSAQDDKVGARFQKFVKSKKFFLCPNPECRGPQPRYTHVLSGFDIAIKIDWKETIHKYGKHLAKSAQVDANAGQQDIEDFRARLLPLTDLAKQPFTSADVKNILNGIDDETCALLGGDPELSPPKNMILTRLLVPSTVIRPAAITAEGRPRNHDDLTEKLKDIVMANKSVRTAILAATDNEHDTITSTTQLLADNISLTSVLAAVKDLQYHVGIFMTNEVSGLKTDRQRSGAATKSLSMRLKGKEGRFRGNICGKRVNFSARTVISPDPNIDLDQLGVPTDVAMNLTFPERVNRWNIEVLMRRIAMGAHSIDGARNLIRADGTLIDLRHVQDGARLRLRYGDTVDRYMQHDDIVIFNRQPSLHKQSMMGHRVVIMPGKTFRLNPIVLGPYNGDFDGDEMNMHLLQSYEAQAEVKELMAVNKNIISAKASKPCIGLIQDACLGAYLLTKRDTFVTKEKACQLLSQCHHLDSHSSDGHWLPPPAILKPRRLWTGKQIFSCLLPKGLVYKRWRQEATDKGNLDYTDGMVLIHSGQLLSGRLCKDTLGPTYGSIHHSICRLMGSGGGLTAAAEYLADLQRMVNWHLSNRGFSIGVSDNIIPQNDKDDIHNMQETLMHKVSTIYEKMIDEEGFAHAELEPHFCRLLRRGLSMTSAMADKHLDDDNAIWAMVHSGSKGNVINIGQMTASLGQQCIEGKRMSGRPLPGFPPDERHPMARGYVRNSLMEGLTVAEFFAHAIGGREGLVDTAGYLFRFRF